MDVAQQEIANKTGISLGTVRNIIGELRGGRFSLYTEYLDWLDDMRWVSHILKRENRSLKEVVVGWSAVEALRELGIDPSELLLIVQLFRRLCGPGFPVEGFVAAALRIADLEKTTNLDFDELEEQAKRRQAEIDMKEKTVRELTETVESIRAAKAKEEPELQQLRVLRERELERNRTTSKELENYVRIRHGLSGKGISVEKLDSRAQLMAEFEKDDRQAHAKIKHSVKNDSM